MDIAYTLSVTVTRPVESWHGDDTQDELREAAEWMVGKDAKRELEKEVLQALQKIDGDCDVEVMDVTRETTMAEDDAARRTDEGRLQGLADRGCDTWEEYRCER